MRADFLRRCQNSQKMVLKWPTPSIACFVSNQSLVFLLTLNFNPKTEEPMNYPSCNSINESTFDELLAGGVIGGDPKVIKCTKNQ